MPFNSEGVQPGIGLALSGGGFRATLFHLGSLWRLNELGYLPKLDRISSVSGGSITAGRLAVRWGQLTWDGPVATNFQAEIVTPLRDFCTRNIDGPAIGEGALLPWKRVSDVVQAAYREHLLGDSTLQALPDHPQFVINATNFGTGVDFRFSKPYAGDYRIGLIPNPTFPLALAVAASSAFPPFLSPVVIDADPATFQYKDGADLYEQIAYRTRLFLTDGGVYDNLGLETVDKRFRTVLVSDAGAPLDVTPDPGTSWTGQALRAMDVTTNQARALRKHTLVNDLTTKVHDGASWGIMTEIAGYELPDALPVPSEATHELMTIRTRLNPFSEEEQCRLINGGYALCDAAMRKYVVATTPVPARQWPYPTHALDQPPTAPAAPPIAPDPPSGG
jgi:NTE family protein